MSEQLVTASCRRARPSTSFVGGPKTMTSFSAKGRTAQRSAARSMARHDVSIIEQSIRCGRSDWGVLVNVSESGSCKWIESPAARCLTMRPTQSTNSSRRTSRLFADFDGKSSAARDQRTRPHSRAPVVEPVRLAKCQSRPSSSSSSSLLLLLNRRRCRFLSSFFFTTLFAFLSALARPCSLFSAPSSFLVYGRSRRNGSDGPITGPMRPDRVGQRVLIGFYWFSLTSSRFESVLPGFSAFYRVLLG